MKYINEFSINENKKSSISFTIYFHLGGCDEDVHCMYLYALAKNSKQLDKLYGQDKLEISNKIKNVIEKTGLEVSWDTVHPGAGYWFKIYPSSIENLLGIKNIKIDV